MEDSLKTSRDVDVSFVPAPDVGKICHLQYAVYFHGERQSVGQRHEPGEHSDGAAEQCRHRLRTAGSEGQHWKPALRPRSVPVIVFSLSLVYTIILGVYDGGRVPLAHPPKSLKN